jgi:hypothetical protein
MDRQNEKTDSPAGTRLGIKLPAHVGRDALKTTVFAASGDADIDRLVHAASGGNENVQAVYPLSPLQDGILPLCLLNENSDTYIFSALFELDSRQVLDTWIDAINYVLERHEILRVSVVWEHISRPLQVVHRQVTLPIQELSLDPKCDAIQQLRELMKAGKQQPMNLRRAPLVRLGLAPDPSSRKWYALLHVHHLVTDIQVAPAIYLNRKTMELSLPRPSERLRRTRQGHSFPKASPERMSQRLPLAYWMCVETAHVSQRPPDSSVWR